MARTSFTLLVLLALFLACHGCWMPEEAALHAALPLEIDSPLDCSRETAEQQLNHFMKALTSQPYYSACADHWWLRDVAGRKITANEQHTIVMDVGCNKGYFSAAALNHLAPEYGDHPQLLYKSHLARGIYTRPCGACNECKQGAEGGGSAAPSGGTVDVLCFEPSEVHIESLKRARDAVYGTPKPISNANAAAAATQQRTRVNFHIRQEAVSNRTGTAIFPVNCTQNTCSVGASGKAPAFTDHDARAETVMEVPLTTVDHEMRALGWPYLDVLKIDTEGYDPAVLAGAYHSLLVRRIGAVSFEYHHLWQRTGASLRQCMSYMAALGYACYYDAAVTARISGSCWLDAYELRRWTNIVCAVSGSKIDAALLEGSYLAQLKHERRSSSH